MEILILLKANIVKKKGAFISILLLTWLIVAMMTTFFSVRDNYDKGLENALEYSDSGDIRAFIKEVRLTDEICSSVENHELVGRVKYDDAIQCNLLRCNENEYKNATFMLKMHDKIRLFNESLDGFEDEIPELKSGEIYLPLGLKNHLYCAVGDTITVELVPGQTENFIIKGIVEEPVAGATTIGWKQLFISENDFDRIAEQCSGLETDDIALKFKVMIIYQAENGGLSSTKFQRQLNLDTGIVSVAKGAINKDQTLRYSTLLPDVIMDIVTVFAIFLFVVVLIVMSHSVGTEIEIDYTLLGVMKSQGFTQGKIRILFILQYVLAQVIGIAFGNVTAIFLEKTVGSACQMITGVLPAKGFSAGRSLMLAAAIIIVSAVLIFIKTGKVAAISPVRAISGGREEIFFDNRLRLPITQRGILSSLSLRQFTSAKKRYMGTICIVALLTFSMITVNLTGIAMHSRNAMGAMGFTIYDIAVYHNSVETLDNWSGVDEIVESHSKITEKNSNFSMYMSLNGESLYCDAYEFPEYMGNILKGRAPLYENEIVITEMVADALELKMGDEVIVSYMNSEKTFLISGIYQSGNDSGMVFSMSYGGMKRMGKDALGLHYYIIEDKSKTDTIAAEIREKYGDYLEVKDDGNNFIMAQYDDVVDLLKLIIYTCSLLFAVIVVRMVCTKTFIQERTDIGIYKGLGFTSNMLRLQFAFRFLIIAAVGSVAGVILSVLLSARMLCAVFKLIGLSRVVLEYEPVSMTVPMILISLAFFVFSYFASGSIRRVEVKELVTE